MLAALIAAAALSAPGQYYDIQPAWSSDARRVAFVRATRLRSRIYVVRPNGRGMRRLVRGNHVTAPAWSADGRSLAYVAERPEADGRTYVPDRVVVARSDGSH